MTIHDSSLASSLRVLVVPRETACRSWPKHERGAPLLALPLGEALERRWHHEAYFVARAPTLAIGGCQRRLTRTVLTEPGCLALIGGEIRIQLGFFDVDAPKHVVLTADGAEQKDKRSGDLVMRKSAPHEVAEWWDEVARDQVAEFLEAHPGAIAYRSKGGVRLLWVRATPITIKSEDDDKLFAAQVVAEVAHLRRRFGLAADCLHEFERFQRVPHDQRAGDSSPAELWQSWEGLSELAAIDLALTDEDRVPLKAKRGRPRKEGETTTSTRPLDRPTLLRRLLEHRGARCSLVEPGVWDIECPASAGHSPNAEGERDYAGKTWLYEVAEGELGFIHCMSASCQATHPTSLDYVKEFSDAERDAVTPRPLPVDDVGAVDPDGDYVPEPPDGVPAAKDGEIDIAGPDAYMQMAHICLAAFPSTCRWRADWYLWTGARYDVVGVERMRAMVRAVLERCVFPYKKMMMDLRPSVATVTNALEAIQAVPGVLQDDELAPPFKRGGGVVDMDDCVVFRNGMLDTRSGMLTPASPDVFNLTCIEADYKRDAACPEWIAFLDKQWAADPASKQLLQEWFGYCFTSWFGIHKMFFLQGPRRSGKGTVSQVLKRLMGQRFVDFDVSDMSGEFPVQPFIDKRVACDTDVRWSADNTTRTLSRLLKLSGGDAVSANRKNKPPVPVSGVKVAFFGNEWPTINDRSGALSGRLLLASHTHTFFGKEDSGLLARLTAELDGVATWAVEGLARLRRNGKFTETSVHMTARDEIADAGNPTLRFLREELVLGKEEWVSREELRASYLDYQRRAGVGALGEAKFARELKLYADERGVLLDVFHPTINGRRVWCYRGVRLADMGTQVSRAELHLVKTWLARPQAYLGMQYGVRNFAAFGENKFTIADILTHALEIPRERQHYAESRVSDVLRHLGYHPDDTDHYHFQGMGQLASVTPIRGQTSWVREPGDDSDELG